MANLPKQYPGSNQDQDHQDDPYSIPANDNGKTLARAPAGGALTALATLGAALSRAVAASGSRSGKPILLFKARTGDGGTWMYGPKKIVPEENSCWAANTYTFQGAGARADAAHRRAQGADESVAKRTHSAFAQALADLGWTDGRNVRMDLRWGGGDINRTRALARELVGLQPDIIVTNTAPATVALQRETRTIPIVFVGLGDPVDLGTPRSAIVSRRLMRAIIRWPQKARPSVAICACSGVSVALNSRTISANCWNVIAQNSG
jgi:hypothetical protein